MGRGRPLSCFCRTAGIYFSFALRRVARRSGRKPTFLLGRLECTRDRLRSGSLCLDLEKIREAAERVARSEGLEIVDVEWKIGKQRFLRVYIDRVPKPVGETLRKDSGQVSDAAGAVGPAVAHDPYPKISHADCERVSKQLSVIVDVEELIPGPGYILEVSSPGMDRALNKPADFERFKGRLAKITTSEPVGEAKFFEGRLAGFGEGKVRMELKGKEARTVELPIEMIRKANLVVEF
ncbi:MAG: hypothetical protein DMG44_00345 [Acidobacteria bacterium]|nr:MAG: hypothetical protein DMG44_00345 [Acidobacteriota bacterium]